MEALSASGTVRVPCVHLQRLIPSRISFQRKRCLALPQGGLNQRQRHVTRCQLGSSDRRLQKEQHSVSAVPEDSKQQQFAPRPETNTLGAIIRNAAKATAIAVLILAAVSIHVSTPSISHHLWLNCWDSASAHVLMLLFSTCRH